MNREIIAKAEAFLNETFSASSYLQVNPGVRTYRLEHSHRVAHIAKAIAEAEGLDVTSAVVGGLLHDIAYCEEMLPGEERANHGRRSAVIIRPFLESLDLPSDTVNDICYGIAIHGNSKADFEWRRTPLCETIGDADRIDRFDAYRMYESLQTMHFSELPLVQKQEAVNNAIEKLNTSKEIKLGTETATKLWQDRLEYQLDFYARLKAQLDHSMAI